MMVIGIRREAIVVVKLSDALVTAGDLPQAIGRGGVQGHGVATEGLAAPILCAWEVQDALVLDLTHDGVGGIGALWQGCGEGVGQSWQRLAGTAMAST
jgi:hypothetical protein